MTNKLSEDAKVIAVPVKTDDTVWGGQAFIDPEQV
jgi:hypothetical protein